MCKVSLVAKANVPLSGLEWGLRFRLNDIIHKNSRKRVRCRVWKGVSRTKMAKNVYDEGIKALSAINRTSRRGHCDKGQMRSAREQPSEPPYGERERLVAANDAAVCLATVAIALGGCN